MRQKSMHRERRKRKRRRRRRRRRRTTPTTKRNIGELGKIIRLFEGKNWYQSRKYS